MNSDTHAVYSRIAIEKQREVKMFVSLILGSAVGIPFVSAFIQPLFPAFPAFHVLIPALFVVGMLSQIRIQIFHTEEQWFQARAVAETAKSLGWEYMMKSAMQSREQGAENPSKVASDPRRDLSNDADADHRMVQILRDLRGEFKTSLSPKWDEVSIDSEISNEMRRVRSRPLDERKSIYLAKRLDVQIRWYERKAQVNRRNSRIFAVIAATMQAIGLGMAIYVLANGLIPESILDFVATFVAGIVGWSQSRRYAELVEPYSYASETLKDLKQRFAQASDESTFRELVEVSERAISREHQMWQIRRGVTPRKHLNRA